MRPSKSLSRLLYPSLLVAGAVSLLLGATPAPPPASREFGRSDGGASLSPGSNNPLFGEPIVVSTGSLYDVSFLTTGQFSADSHADLVVSMWYSQRVALLLGNGDGTFTSGGIYSVGEYPYGTVAADFNGDGKLDLAVAKESSGISILLGTGLGSFLPPTETAAGTVSRYLASGDFNGDGKTDLATPDEVLSRVRVLLGNGDGSFASPVDYPTGESPQGIVAADFDGDGDDDLVTANYVGLDLSYLAGNGDGTFQQTVSLGGLHYNLQRPSPVLAEDLNGDGNKDLIVGGNATWGVWVMLGRGDGSFQDASGYRTSTWGTPVNLAAGDFNGDAKMDVATPEFFSDAAAILLGIGNGRFVPASLLETIPSIEGVAVADFNEDGWDDLAIAPYPPYQDNVAVYLNLAPFPGTCQDNDQDGFGFPGDPSCPAGAVEDCDDTSAAVSPLAVDVCDGVDNNCDLLDGLDEDMDRSTTCDGDCDDHRIIVHPGAMEYCNGLDEDCDGTADVPGENGSDLAVDSDTRSLAWSASTGYQVTYNLYRGTLGPGAFAYDHTCFLDSLAQPSASDAQVPSVESGFYYVVSGRNSCGEGTLGQDFVGNPRPNLLPCP